MDIFKQILHVFQDNLLMKKYKYPGYEVWSYKFKTVFVILLAMENNKNILNQWFLTFPML